VKTIVDGIKRINMGDRTKITDSLRSEIIDLLNEGLTRDRVADMLEISFGSVDKIRTKMLKGLL